MVGVSIGSIFSNNSNTDYTSSTGTSTTSDNDYGISINPSLGWFVSENLAVGISPTVGYTKKKQLGKSSTGSTYLKDETSDYSFGLGGFTRYYFESKNPSLKFFGQYNLSFGLSGSKSDGFAYETLGIYVDRYNRKSSGDLFVNTGLAFGISKFLSNHTSLDFYVGYNYSYTKSNPTGTSVRDYSDPSTGDITQKVDYDQKVTGNNLVIGVGYQIFIPKMNKARQ